MQPVQQTHRVGIVQWVGFGLEMVSSSKHRGCRVVSMPWGWYKCCYTYLNPKNGPFIYFYMFPHLGMAVRLCNLWTPFSITYLCAHSGQSAAIDLGAAQVTGHTEMLPKPLQRSSLLLLPLLLPDCRARRECCWSQATKTECDRVEKTLRAGGRELPWSQHHLFKELHAGGDVTGD